MQSTTSLIAHIRSTGRFALSLCRFTRLKRDYGPPAVFERYAPSVDAKALPTFWYALRTIQDLGNVISDCHDHGAELERCTTPQVRKAGPLAVALRRMASGPPSSPFGVHRSAAAALDGKTQTREGRCQPSLSPYIQQSVMGGCHGQTGHKKA